MSVGNRAINEQERKQRIEAAARAICEVMRDCDGDAEIKFLQAAARAIIEADGAVPVVSMRHHMAIRDLLLRQAAQLLGLVEPPSCGYAAYADAKLGGHADELP